MKLIGLHAPLIYKNRFFEQTILTRVPVLIRQPWPWDSSKGLCECRINGHQLPRRECELTTINSPLTVLPRSGHIVMFQMDSRFHRDINFEKVQVWISQERLHLVNIFFVSWLPTIEREEKRRRFKRSSSTPFPKTRDTKNRRDER